MDTATTDLQNIISQMQKIQAKIAASGEPPSGHEIDALKKLGQSYGEKISQLAQENTKPNKDIHHS